jgi:hypothetical protein
MKKWLPEDRRGSQEAPASVSRFNHRKPFYGKVLLPWGGSSSHICSTPSEHFSLFPREEPMAVEDLGREESEMREREAKVEVEGVRRGQYGGEKAGKGRRDVIGSN